MRELTQSEKVSQSLLGKFGTYSRRWLGDIASYYAKHMWIVKHYGNATRCELCNSKKAKRFEWAIISGKHRRDINDYMELCPSCHRKLDKGNYCKRGHEFTKENTYLRKEGWRVCRQCQRERFLKWKLNHEKLKLDIISGIRKTKSTP